MVTSLQIMDFWEFTDMPVQGSVGQTGKTERGNVCNSWRGRHTVLTNAQLLPFMERLREERNALKSPQILNALLNKM